MEPNFHMLYIDFVEKIKSKHLNKELVEASYQNCKVISSSLFIGALTDATCSCKFPLKKVSCHAATQQVLLKSPLIKSSDKECKLLKNLGGWIGKITIGKNQVLRAKHIDPKSLIVEAYRKGLMIGVIPFTSKILESCKNSLAYQPPNPYTMAILGLLAEIHAMKNLKVNLKFEIEILFKNLVVDMKDVTPSSLLKSRVRIVEGNPDFSSNSSGSYQKRKDKLSILFTLCETMMMAHYVFTVTISAKGNVSTVMWCLKTNSWNFLDCGTILGINQYYPVIALLTFFDICLFLLKGLDQNRKTESFKKLTERNKEEIVLMSNLPNWERHLPLLSFSDKIAKRWFRWRCSGGAWRRVTVVQVTRFSGFVRNLMVITVVSEVRPHSPEKWLDLAFLRRTVACLAISDPERPKFDKATILGDTIQMLNDLTAQVSRLKSEYTTLTEESRELTQEKPDLREEKASLKSDIDNLNLQYQQRVRAMYPWGHMDQSVVMHPTSYPYPVPMQMPMPPGSIPMHPSIQPYPFFGSQNPGVVSTPGSAFFPPVQYVSPVVQTSTRSQVSSRQGSRNKSSEQEENGSGKDGDSNDVATELELKTSGSTGYQRYPNGLVGTGCKEDKNFNVVLNSVIAGRYHVTEYLGSAAFSKAIQAHDLHTGMDTSLIKVLKLLKYINKHDPGDKYHLLRLYDYFYYHEHLLIVNFLKQTYMNFISSIVNLEERFISQCQDCRTGCKEDKNFNVVLNSVIAGRYHVTEYLGSAAFSKAIQAHDLHTGMDVTFRRDWGVGWMGAFVDCELLKANLYEFHKFNSESGGEVYFTMPRLQSITIQCLEALQFLHGLGLIHCDLKPENILVKSYNRCEVKVIDLGSSYEIA
ncbi:myc-type, basic helix-loop-helix (bHLH) domain-containing protein [Artemisia annua]|uniref:Myc-type, basic helix-loop-helix (BHLH) domain-containing protein n=1 Tax=Artemisia annua TaxID=35608 RepID=A0A2U1N9I0_ARTAN|nr:myc-type, basic helix-loop-helix (bHLH) domain-containing protein [Artemisia annua]